MIVWSVWATQSLQSPLLCSHAPSPHIQILYVKQAGTCIIIHTLYTHTQRRERQSYTTRTVSNRDCPCMLTRIRNRSTLVELHIVAILKHMYNYTCDGRQCSTRLNSWSCVYNSSHWCVVYSASFLQPYVCTQCAVEGTMCGVFQASMPHTLHSHTRWYLVWEFWSMPAIISMDACACSSFASIPWFTWSLVLECAVLEACRQTVSIQSVGKVEFISVCMQHTMQKCSLLLLCTYWYCIYYQ